MKSYEILSVEIKIIEMTSKNVQNVDFAQMEFRPPRIQQRPLSPG